MKKNSFKKPPFSLDRSRHGDLVGQLSSALRQAIDTGYYKAGDILPPVRDLAELLDVSCGVAAQAMARIREAGLISPRPCIGSVVCPKDRPPWKGHVVTVIPPGVFNPSDTAVHAVLRDRLTAAGYLVTPVTVAETSPRRFDDFSLLDTVLRQQTNLIIQLHRQENITRWLSKRGIPFVRLADDGTAPPHCVGVVRRDFGRALPDFAAHCREAGVKSVLQVADILRADATEELSKAGISVKTLKTPRALVNGPGYDFADWATVEFTKRLAKGRGWLPDLLFFQNDHLASGALQALGFAGLRIPEDIRVVSWANRRYGPFFFKPVTRMEMDNAAVGATLAKNVLEYLRNGAFPQGVVVGPTYIKGETM